MTTNEKRLTVEVKRLREVLSAIADCDKATLSTVGDGQAMLKAIANDAFKALCVQDHAPVDRDQLGAQGMEDALGING